MFASPQSHLQVPGPKQQPHGWACPTHTLRANCAPGMVPGLADSAQEQRPGRLDSLPSPAAVPGQFPSHCLTFPVVKILAWGLPLCQLPACKNWEVSREIRGLGRDNDGGGL